MYVHVYVYLCIQLKRDWMEGLGLSCKSNLTDLKRNLRLPGGKREKVGGDGGRRCRLGADTSVCVDVGNEQSP